MTTGENMIDDGRLDDEDIKTQSISMLQPRLDDEDIDMGSIAALQPADVEAKFRAMDETAAELAARYE